MRPTTTHQNGYVFPKEERDLPLLGFSLGNPAVTAADIRAFNVGSPVFQVQNEGAPELHPAALSPPSEAG